MDALAPTWTILVYKLPPEPTRLRLSIWRRLQKLGAIYLQDGVAIVPDRPNLTENLHYVAQSIEEMDGMCYLFAASSLLPGDPLALIRRFQDQAEKALGEIAERVSQMEERVSQADDPTELHACEEDLRRERLTFLRAQQQAFFGAEGVDTLTARFENLKARLAAMEETK